MLNDSRSMQIASPFQCGTGSVQLHSMTGNNDESHHYNAGNGKTVFTADLGGMR